MMSIAKTIADKATAIIFLNQQWLGHLRSELEQGGLLNQTLDDFVDHAKWENRTAFQEINKLGQEPEAATLPAAAVRDALAELRAQMEINANPEAAYWAVRLRATMTALGLGAEGEKR